jgi:hypothetical protein
MSNPRFAHVHLRDRLDELVSSVTQRLSLVLDQPRALAVHDRAQLDRMTLEFASLQRTVLTELASPRAQREDVLATILDIQLVAVRLLDQIEALVWANSVPPVQAPRPDPFPDPVYRGLQAAQLPPTNVQPPTPSEQLWPPTPPVSPAAELHPPERQSHEPYSQALKFAVIQSHAEASTQLAREDAGRYGASVHADGRNATQSALQFASFVSAPPRSNSTAIAVRPNTTSMTTRAKPLRSARGWLTELTPGRSAVAACSIIVGGLMVGWFTGSPQPDASPEPAQTRLESKLAGQARPTGVAVAGFSTGTVQAQSSSPLYTSASGDSDALAVSPQNEIYVPVIATVEDPVAAQLRLSQLKAAYPGLIDAVAGVNTELVRSADGTPWYRTYLLPARSRGTAKDFCRNLRQAGYQECWVKPLG